eukprot:scaffold252764_cov18-Tisochrysis_lutea.AAC.2
MEPAHQKRFHRRSSSMIIKRSQILFVSHSIEHVACCASSADPSRPSVCTSWPVASLNHEASKPNKLFTFAGPCSTHYFPQKALSYAVAARMVLQGRMIRSVRTAAWPLQPFQGAAQALSSFAGRQISKEMEPYRHAAEDVMTQHVRQVGLLQCQKVAQKEWGHDCMSPCFCILPI